MTSETRPAYRGMRSTRLTIEELAARSGSFDYAVHFWNENDRTTAIRNALQGCPSSHWLQHEHLAANPASEPPEDATQLPNGDELERMNLVVDELVNGGYDEPVVDITGLLSHNLLALIRLCHARGVAKLTFVYAGPGRYALDEETEFATQAVDVRQVSGFAGTPDNGAAQPERLVVGLGYDGHLVREVCASRSYAERRIVFGLPALQPDMYTDSWMRTLRVEEAVGPDALEQPLFAPADNPFATAEVLSQEVARAKTAGCQNVYLAPLGPRPMVLGFGLFYLAECLNSSVSCVLPYSIAHHPSTSEGVGGVWLYPIDFNYLRSLYQS